MCAINGTDGTGGVSIRETGAGGRESVEGRGRGRGGRVEATQIAEAEVVGKHDHDVGW